MKGLNLDGGESQETATKKPEKSQKDASKQKKAHGKARAQKDSEHQEPPKSIQVQPEIPKVKLPTKISFNARSPFICQPVALWHTSIPPLSPSSTSVPPITPSQLASLTERASELHYADIQTFQTSSSSNSSSSEASFLSKIIQSGTLSDRLSALTLLVQSSPIHNTKALETLKSMAERGKGKGGREESLKALRCVVDWWVGGGAPDRKLK